MKPTLLFTLLILAAPDMARAEFINSYSQWSGLNPTDKGLYAAGLVDGDGLLRLTNWRDDPTMLPKMDGMNRCIKGNNLNGALLSKMIDNAYAADVTRWPTPPNVVLADELEKLCRPWVEQSRRRLAAPVR